MCMKALNSEAVTVTRRRVSIRMHDSIMLLVCLVLVLKYIEQRGVSECTIGVIILTF